MANQDHIVQSIKDALHEAEARGYQRGWEACLTAMVTAASKQKAMPTAPRDTTDSTAGESYAVTVLRALTVKPGSTGPQIQAWLREHDLPDNRIAMRSAIRRLLKQGKIEQRGLKYIPKAERKES